MNCGGEGSGKLKNRRRIDLQLHDDSNIKAFDRIDNSTGNRFSTSIVNRERREKLGGENREDGKKSGGDFRSWKIFEASENTAERHGDDARDEDERGENEVRCLELHLERIRAISRVARPPICVQRASSYLDFCFFLSFSLFFLSYIIGISFTREMEKDIVSIIKLKLLEIT